MLLTKFFDIFNYYGLSIKLSKKLDKFLSFVYVKYGRSYLFVIDIYKTTGYIKHRLRSPGLYLVDLLRLTNKFLYLS